ncbi:MAG: Trm112 family protein [Verrucomicrobiota bacterium]|nr:Trm112 family protein [Verrucomicrobiota bacterium]
MNKKLLKILACPACPSRPSLKFNEEENRLICEICNRAYPIKNDIPVLLPDQAEKTKNYETNTDQHRTP